MNFDDAISAHVRWKMRLRDFLAGKIGEPFDPESLLRDDRCELGEWIHQEGRWAILRDPDFQELKAVHLAFHLHVGEIVREAESDPRVALFLLDGDSFLELSMKVITCLQRLKKKCTRSSGSPDDPDRDSNGSLFKAARPMNA